LRENDGKDVSGGLVYAVTAPHYNAVKLGKWTGDVNSLFKRYRTLLTSSMEVHYIFVHDPGSVERDLLREFLQYNIEGEVFSKEHLGEYTQWLSSRAEGGGGVAFERLQALTTSAPEAQPFPLPVTSVSQPPPVPEPTAEPSDPSAHKLLQVKPKGNRLLIEQEREKTKREFAREESNREIAKEKDITKREEQKLASYLFRDGKISFEQLQIMLENAR
jgi:hypothetical protein